MRRNFAGVREGIYWLKGMCQKSFSSFLCWAVECCWDSFLLVAELVDKDNNPRWHPLKLEDVADADIDAIFEPFSNSEDELKLEKWGWYLMFALFLGNLFLKIHGAR